jgi:hypothetical protein
MRRRPREPDYRQNRRKPGVSHGACSHPPASRQMISLHAWWVLRYSGLLHAIISNIQRPMLIADHGRAWAQRIDAPGQHSMPERRPTQQRAAPRVHDG